MANLAEWLLAQYDADEQIARAAAEVNPPPWRLLALPYADRDGYDPAWAPD